MKMNKKGFTLIELLAVIIILAIIALIATPIVMNVINKAQEGADLRSVEAYGKELESAYYQYQIENPNLTAAEVTTLKGNLLVSGVTDLMTFSGNTVTCTGAELEAYSASDSTEVVKLTGCTVGNRTQAYIYNSKDGADKAA